MVVKLQNGDTYIIDNMNDIRNLVDEDLFEVINELTDAKIQEATDEIEEENDANEIMQEEAYIEKSKELEDRENKLEKREDDLEEAIRQSKETVLTVMEINQMRDVICRLSNMNTEYKKSKSKRVDKDTFTTRFDEAIKEFGDITNK